MCKNNQGEQAYWISRCVGYRENRRIGYVGALVTGRTGALGMRAHSVTYKNIDKENCMCVIVTKEAGVRWPEKSVLENCFKANPDGAGFAAVYDHKICVKRGFFAFDRLYDALLQYETCPVLLHCRIATHGSVSTRNCHPFLLKNKVALAHNGILRDQEVPKKDMTDSEAFGRQYIEAFRRGELSDKRIIRLLEAAIGKYNKMALLTADGELIHVNKAGGCEEYGLWFSNDSYEPPACTWSYARGYEYDGEPFACKGCSCKNCMICPYDRFDELPKTGDRVVCAGMMYTVNKTCINGKGEFLVKLGGFPDWYVWDHAYTVLPRRKDKARRKDEEGIFDPVSAV
jgi:glutamine amidotransferase